MLKSILDFVEYNKATGATEALIESAQTHKGWLVVATAAEAQKRAPYLPGVTVISMENLIDDDSSWMWDNSNKGPIFFDPKAIAWLAQHMMDVKGEANE